MADFINLSNLTSDELREKYLHLYEKDELSPADRDELNYLESLIVAQGF